MTNLRTLIQQGGGPFDKLLGVFSEEVLDLPVSLLAEVDENELLERMTNQNHNLLFKIFYRRYIATFCTDKDIFLSPVVDKSNSLILRGRVWASESKIGGTMSNCSALNIVHADGLTEWASMTLTPAQRQAVTCVDLSDNDLKDGDMEYVAQLMNVFPECK